MQKSKTTVKWFLLAALCCLLGTSTGVNAVHAEGSASYNYSFWNDTVAAPAAYEAASLLSGAQLGVGPFKNPSDIHVTADKRIYVLDSGNNRIVVLDEQFKLGKGGEFL